MTKRFSPSPDSPHTRESNRHLHSRQQESVQGGRAVAVCLGEKTEELQRGRWASFGGIVGECENFPAKTAKNLMLSIWFAL
jgi:hypothetical protein